MHKYKMGRLWCVVTPMTMHNLQELSFLRGKKIGQVVDELMIEHCATKKKTTEITMYHCIDADRNVYQCHRCGHIARFEADGPYEDGWCSCPHCGRDIVESRTHDT